MFLKVPTLVLLISICNLRKIGAIWTENSQLKFEQSLIKLADEWFPIDKSETEFLERRAKFDRVKRSEFTCPGGNGKFGFNSYSLPTAVILG